MIKTLLLISTFFAMGFISYADPDYPTIEKTLALGEAESFKTKILFSAGELIINPIESKNLFEGRFKFYKKNKPEIIYEEKGSTGYLEISDDGFDLNYDNDNQTKWAIDLNKDVINEILVDMTAGKAEVNLQDCNIESFVFEISAGEARINLRNTSVKDVNFSGKAGEAHIDLSGQWNNDLDARIKGGIGEINLILPQNIGIEMNISGLLGERKVPGFYQDGNLFTNELLGKTDHTLYIDVTGGIGSVTVTTVP